MKPHLLLTEYVGLPGGMRELYRTLGVIPTSDHATEILIRSHIAYHAGLRQAEEAEIKPSRGHSYRINKTCIVKITDYYDHRNGIVGFTQPETITYQLTGRN